jgi:tetratricopeptide (TPR) repeat protein
LTNANGETIDRWWGYDAAPEFVEHLQRASADPTTIAEKQERFADRPTVDDAAALGIYYLSSGKPTEAVEYYERGAEMSGPDGGFEYELFEAKAIGHREELFDLEQVKRAADAALASDRLSTDDLLNIAHGMASALEDHDPAAAAPYLEAGLAATEGVEDPDLEPGRRSLRILQALMVTGDTELAVRLRRESLPEGWEEDSDELNGFAWWCFENEVNLEQAETLARKGAELAEDAGQKAQILDTLAEIVNLRGDRDAAIATMHQAIELDPENEYYQEQLTRFEGEIAETM